MGTSWFIYMGLILTLTNTSFCKNLFKDPGICGRPTCRVPQKFGYKETSDYMYKYTANSSTIFDGAGNDTSILVFNCIVQIQFRSTCEGVLKITEPELYYGTEGNLTAVSSENVQVISQNILRFQYDDGSIPEVCPEKNEPVWVLNIKKGILSVFQNKMERFDVDQYLLERDVNGDCTAGYFFKEVDGTTLVIDKKWQIFSCVNRYQVYSIIPLTPYIFQKKYHKWTPMNSTVFCSQHIDHKIQTGIACEEHHEYVPFYNQTNGAKSKANIQLTLLSENDLSLLQMDILKDIGYVEERHNLLFDHRRPSKTTHDNLNECKHLLLSLCAIDIIEFKPKYTEYFNKLVHVARDLSVPALMQLYAETKDLCETARLHMMDALPYVRSRAATKIMTDIINQKLISEAAISEWLFIMTFYPRPDGETIDAVSKLIFDGEYNAQTLLTVTTMIHNFCERSSQCHGHPTVINIVRKLEGMVKTSCETHPDDMTYSALKALGNAGVLTDTLNVTLQMCFQNQQLPIDLRVLAMDTHRRLPCETNRNMLLEMFDDNMNDGELRIAAYLQIMRCPTYAILRAVKTTLRVEEYNQVGSFVWSHLNTQVKSSFPNRVEVQAMLQDQYFSDKFDKDFRQYSRNYESSFYLNRYGIGGFTETNVIFSHKSYIPRIITVNTTVILFGEALNICQVTLHLQGLESFMEKIFHKSTIFNKEIVDGFMKFIRKIRSAPNPLEVLINDLPYKVLLDEVKVGISFKMFGNDVNYFQIKGLDEFVTEMDKLNPMKIIRNFLSGQEFKFAKVTMLIDTSYTTPMLFGMPLKLNAIGTAAVKTYAQGFVNSSSFVENKALKIIGKLVPSIGLSFECSMEVDAFLVLSGIKFKGTVYTSSALEGSFTMKNYEFVQFSFNLPRDKSDLVHAETHLLLMLNDEEIELQGITAGRSGKKYCTWDVVDEIIGLKMCANTLLPDQKQLLKKPIFLLSGPLQLGVTLEKSDPSAKLYIVEYKVETININ